MRARTVLILLVAVLAGAGCGSDQVSQQASRPTARGDAPDSLFRSANLRTALGVLRRHVGAAATLASFRLEAGALTAEVEGGSGRSVVVSKSFKLTSVPTPGVAPAAATVGLAQIDPGAPQRMMGQVQPRSGVGLRGVDYFLIAADLAPDRPGWVVYLKQGRGNYSADLSGQNVNAFGASPSTTPTAPTTPGPTPSTTTAPGPATTPTDPATVPSRAQIERRAQCIVEARGDAAKIAACRRGR